MADDKVTLYNQALSVVGAKSKVSLPTEKSKEAEECELWFPTVRDQVLRAAPWPSATTSQRLAVLKERADEAWTAGDPEPGFRFAYGAPSDMIQPQYLSTFERFSVGIYNGNQRSIMADTEQALLIYTMRLTAINLWDAGLRAAILYGLAAAICNKLTGKRDLAQLTEQKANETILIAQAQSANSEQEFYETMPEWFSARGFGLISQNKYVYPQGPLLQNVGGAGVR